MAKIAIIEDDHQISELLKRTLEKTGHQCQQFYTGSQALPKINKETFQLIILDVGLPDLDGFMLFPQLPKLPLIFLTARDEIDDRVRGLKLGAEDYLIKPFAMEELLARVDVILRRFYPQGESLELKQNLFIHLKERKVLAGEKELLLTTQEYLLLESLVLNRNLVLSREQLLNSAWGIDFYGDIRTVDVHIQRLRKKLGLENQIKTIFKFGYRLELD